MWQTVRLPTKQSWNRRRSGIFLRVFFKKSSKFYLAMNTQKGLVCRPFSSLEPLVEQIFHHKLLRHSTTFHSRSWKLMPYQLHKKKSQSSFGVWSINFHSFRLFSFETFVCNLRQFSISFRTRSPPKTRWHNSMSVKVIVQVEIEHKMHLCHVHCLRWA